MIKKLYLSDSEFNQFLELNRCTTYDPRMAVFIRQRNELILKFLYHLHFQWTDISQLKWTNFYTEKDKSESSILLKYCKSYQSLSELVKQIGDWESLISEKLKYYSLQSNYVFPSLGFRNMGEKLTHRGINDVIVSLGKLLNWQTSISSIRSYEEYQRLIEKG